MDKKILFELITDYVAKNHPEIFMEAINNVKKEYIEAIKGRANTGRAMEFLKSFGITTE